MNKFVLKPVPPGNKTRAAPSPTGAHLRNGRSHDSGDEGDFHSRPSSRRNSTTAEEQVILYIKLFFVFIN